MTVQEFSPQLTLLDLDRRDDLATPSPTVGVLTWNVQHASPARARRQAAWLAAEEGADVVLLTEVPWGDGLLATAQALSECGYHVLVPAGRDTDYRVLLASRLGRLTPVDVGVRELPHRCLGATLDLGDTRTIGLVALYVPSRGPQAVKNVAKRAFQTSVSDALPTLNAAFGRLSAGLVVAGDLNVVEPDHVPRHSVFGGWEYEFYRAFAAAGLTDVYRHLHPTEVEHSWFGRRSGEGYRFDHIFASMPEHIVDCRYIHGPREEALSDHSAMVATLSPTSQPTATRSRAPAAEISGQPNSE